MPPDHVGSTLAKREDAIMRGVAHWGGSAPRRGRGQGRLAPCHAAAEPRRRPREGNDRTRGASGRASGARDSTKRRSARRRRSRVSGAGGARARRRGHRGRGDVRHRTCACVLEAASGSTRGREAGLRGARLSALPHARIVLIARRKATQNLLFFFLLVGRARAAESDHAASIARKNETNETSV